MSDSSEENKARNRQIAGNEAERQTVGDIRVSAWAIAVAIIIGLAAVGWVLLHTASTDYVRSVSRLLPMLRDARAARSSA